VRYGGDTGGGPDQLVAPAIQALGSTAGGRMPQGEARLTTCARSMVAVFVERAKTLAVWHATVARFAERGERAPSPLDSEGYGVGASGTARRSCVTSIVRKRIPQPEGRYSNYADEHYLST
jgi:hypothetical protein